MAIAHPTRDEILDMLVARIYRGPVLNNAHRGDIVEMMVLAALGPEWRLVGLGWHPWDLQKGSGASRVRIQVKQAAALQLWGPTTSLRVVFGWKKQAPSYFARDNPGEAIESEGWFCEVFVIGVHLETDVELADQVDPAQWRFLVIPSRELTPRQNTMPLAKALERWPPVPWNGLANALARATSSGEDEGGGQ